MPAEKFSWASWITTSPYISDQPVSEGAHITFAACALSLEGDRRMIAPRNSKHGRSSLKIDFRMIFFSMAKFGDKISACKVLARFHL